MTRVFFDLDGTLVDPAVGITSSIVYALERLGRPPCEPSSLHWCIGPPLQNSFARLLDTDDEAAAWRGVELYRERYRSTGVYECELYAGVPEALGLLRVLVRCREA